MQPSNSNSTFCCSIGRRSPTKNYNKQPLVKITGLRRTRGSTFPSPTQKQTEQPMRVNREAWPLHAIEIKVDVWLKAFRFRGTYCNLSPNNLSIYHLITQGVFPMHAFVLSLRNTKYGSYDTDTQHVQGLLNGSTYVLPQIAAKPAAHALMSYRNKQSLQNPKVTTYGSTRSPLQSTK